MGMRVATCFVSAEALGSVTITVDASGSIVDCYRYKPYGGLASKTGVGVEPSFQLSNAV
jgi:hypothetical protein